MRLSYHPDCATGDNKADEQQPLLLPPALLSTSTAVALWQHSGGTHRLPASRARSRALPPSSAAPARHFPMLRWSAAALCAAVNVKLPWRAEPPAHHHVDGVGTGARAPVPVASSLAGHERRAGPRPSSDEQPGLTDDATSAYDQTRERGAETRAAPAAASDF